MPRLPLVAPLMPGLILCLTLPVAAETELLPPDPARGEAAYAEACAECHRSPARFMARVPGEDDAARAAWLEDFLPEHYAPDPQARADMIAWLLEG